MLKNTFIIVKLFNATFTSNENRKIRITNRLNRVRKTVSFESVNVDSEFYYYYYFFCPTLATRRKTSLSVS